MVMMLFDFLPFVDVFVVYVSLIVFHLLLVVVRNCVELLSFSTCVLIVVPVVDVIRPICVVKALCRFEFP